MQLQGKPTEVVIRNGTVANLPAATFEGHPQIQSLTISSTKVSGRLPFGSLPRLETLIFEDVEQIPEDMFSGARVPSLRSLSLHGHFLTKRMIADVARFDHVEQLSISDYDEVLDSKCYIPIGQLSNLKRLYIGDACFSKESIRAMARCESLEDLGVGSNEHPFPISELKAFGKLESLTLWSCSDLDVPQTDLSVRDLCLNHVKHPSNSDLRGFRNLTSLTFYGAEIAPTALANSHFPCLRSIDFTHCGVSPSICDRIARSRALQHVRLHSCRGLNSESIRSLASIPELTQLDLGYTHFDDVDAVISAISELRALRYLNTEGGPLEGVELPGEVVVTEFEFVNDEWRPEGI